MKLWDKLHKYLPILGILLFVLVIWKFGPSTIFNALSQAKLIYLLIFVVIFVPAVIIQAFKWYYILKLQNINIDFFEAFKFHIVSTFLGLITPGRIGLFSKVFFLKNKYNKSIGECTSSVILDKLSDFILLFIFAFFGTIFLLHRYDLYLLIGILLFFFIAGFFLLFNKKITRFLLKGFYNYLIPKKFKETIRINFYGFYDNMPKFSKLIIPFFLTFVTWTLLFTQAYVLSLAFNIKVPYILFVLIIAIVTLITLLPITISGLGTRDVALLALLSGFGINSGNILAYSITSSFSGPLLFFIGYMFYAKKIKLINEDGKEKTS